MKNNNKTLLKLPHKLDDSDAFHRLSEDLLKVGDQMDRAKGSYSEAMRRLTEGPGNLVGRVEKLKKLGAKATKQQNEKLLRRSQESDNEE